MSDNVTGVKQVGDSLQINIPNGVKVYVWWKDEDTVRITATPEDFMYDIKPGQVVRYNGGNPGSDGINGRIM